MARFIVSQSRTSMSLSLSVEFQNDLDIVISEDEHVAVVVKHEVAALIVHNVAARMCWQRPSGLWHGRVGRAN